jgi:hypothetical protein
MEELPQNSSASWNCWCDKVFTPVPNSVQGRHIATLCLRTGNLSKDEIMQK